VEKYAKIDADVTKYAMHNHMGVFIEGMTDAIQDRR